MHRRPLAEQIRLFVVTLSATAAFLLPQTVSAAVTDNVKGWMWSGSVGWISANCVDLASCATSNYGLTLTDAGGGVANLTGYAWAGTVGWVCFGATCTAAGTGNTPEGTAPYAQFRAATVAAANGKSNQFWGWAKVLNMGAEGWISLNCDKDTGADACATSNHFVGYNMSAGNFIPGAANDHWAWSGSNEGTGIGWVDFSLLTSDWVLGDLGKMKRPEGYYDSSTVSTVNCTPSSGPSAVCMANAPWTACSSALSKCVLPGSHNSLFTIAFPTLSAYTGQRLECSLGLPDGSTRVVGKNLTYAGVRNVNTLDTLAYAVQAADTTRTNTIWIINSCRLGGLAGLSCVSDAACGAGAWCDASTSKCRTVVSQIAAPRPVFAHDVDWTELDNKGQLTTTVCTTDAQCRATEYCESASGRCRAFEDEYLALKCYAGFPGNYFNSAARCDLMSDVSHAQRMSASVLVESNCGDGVDNDGINGIDCADPACKGISYLCTGATLPRNTCTFGNAADGIMDCNEAAWVAGQLCCTRQPSAPNGGTNYVTDGLECVPGDKNDGVFDCSCTVPASFSNGSTDCYAPGYQGNAADDAAHTGDVCCDSNGNVTKQ